MSRKKKIVCVLICILISGILFFTFVLNKKTEPSDDKVKQNNISTEKIEETNFALSKSNEVLMCKNNQCFVESINYYNISYNGEIKEISEIVEKINNDTLAYYDMTINSTMDDISCNSIKDFYNYSLFVNSEFYGYEDDNYVSIAVQRNIRNFCKDEINSLQAEVYIYDKKLNKYLTQDDFKQRLNITEEEIDIVLTNNLNSYNSLMGTNYLLSNTYQNGIHDSRFFYSDEGKLFMSYKQNEDNMYYVVELRD